jgi:hypothetical protein
MDHHELAIDDTVVWEPNVAPKAVLAVIPFGSLAV